MPYIGSQVGSSFSSRPDNNEAIPVDKAEPITGFERAVPKAAIAGVELRAKLGAR